MAQRVITSIKITDEPRVGDFEPESGSKLETALAQGWWIVHVATTAVGNAHFTTCVVEKPDDMRDPKVFSV